MTIDLFIKIIGAILTFLLTMSNPLTGIYMLIIAIPFLQSNELILLFTVLISFSFIFNAIRHKKVAYTKTAITFPILLYLIVQIICTITSVTPMLSLQNFLVSLFSIIMFFIIINTVTTKSILDKCLKMFIFIAFVASCYGILQYFTVGVTDLTWVDLETNPDLTTRVGGPFNNPNIFAEYLEYILPTALVLIFVYKNKINKILLSIMSATILICLVLTFSRGGWLGFAAAIFFFALVKFTRYIPILIAGGIACIPFLPSVILTRLQSIVNFQDTSNSYRINVWQGTIEMIKDFLFTGVGYGYWAYKSAYIHYSVNATKVWHSHNVYLQILAETGIFGFISFTLVIISLFVLIISHNKKSNDIYSNYVSLALLCGIISLLVHGFAEHILYMPKSIIEFWMILGFAIAAINIKDDKKLT